MTTPPNPDAAPACSLTHDQAIAQLGEWADLADDAIASSRTDGHLSVVLPIGDLARVEDLAARERSCCAFLDIAVAVDEANATVTVTVDSPAASADDVVAFIGRRP